MAGGWSREQCADEQAVRLRLAAPRLLPEAAGNVRQVDERAVEPRIIARVAALRPAQGVQHGAVPQDVNVDTARARSVLQTFEIASRSLDLRENLRAAHVVVDACGNRSESGQTQPSVPEPRLPESSARLERDDQHVLRFRADGLQHPSGEQRRRPDAGERYRVPFHRLEPRGQHTRAGDRAEQHTVVAPSRLFPAQYRGMNEAGLVERPARPGAKHGATLPHGNVGYAILPEFLLDHVGDDAGDFGGIPVQIAGIFRGPLLADVERGLLGRTRPAGSTAPAMDGQPRIRHDEDASRRHHVPISAMRS